VKQKKAALFEKSAQKLLLVFTRGVSMSPGGKLTKIFAELFLKSDRLLKS